MARRSIERDVNVIERLLIGGCDRTRAHLSALLDGELHGLRGLRVRAHVARCELCRTAYESLVRAVERLRSLRDADPAAPVSVADAVVARLRR